MNLTIWLFQGSAKRTAMAISTDFFVQFVSNDGKNVFVEGDIVENIDILNMLYRRGKGHPIVNLNLSENDILLVRAIALIGVYPCPYDTRFIPDEYESAESLGDYVGITGINPDLNVDWSGDYTNDFLSLMGHDIEESNWLYEDCDSNWSYDEKYDNNCSYEENYDYKWSQEDIQSEDDPSKLYIEDDDNPYLS